MPHPFARVSRPSERRAVDRRAVPLPVHVLLMVLVALAVLAGLLWLLTDDRTSPLSAAPTDQTTLEVIRLAFYAVAGLGGVIALTVAYRKQRLNEGESEREQSRLFNERFASAADQLASERAANRLAGVYAMAALADEWDAGRQTCVNVLSAYIRMPYESPPRRVERETIGMDQFRPVLEERLVRKTVLSVMAERLRAEPVPGRTWHECDFDFTGATIDEADFSKAVFRGAVSFEYTHFPRGTCDFSETVFMGPVSFRRSHCSGGRLLFEATWFEHQVDFSQTTVSTGAMSFRDSVFRFLLVGFSDAVFSGGEVRFEGCAFAAHARISFDRAAFSGAEVAFSSIDSEHVRITFESPTAWTHPPVFDDASRSLAPDLD